MSCSGHELMLWTALHPRLHAMESGARVEVIPGRRSRNRYSCCFVPGVVVRADFNGVTGC